MYGMCDTAESYQNSNDRIAVLRLKLAGKGLSKVARARLKLELEAELKKQAEMPGPVNN